MVSVRDYNKFRHMERAMKARNVMKCFKGSLGEWMKAHWEIWENFETFEQVFMQKFRTEEQQEMLRNRIKVAGVLMKPKGI